MELSASEALAGAPTSPALEAVLQACRQGTIGRVRHALGQYPELSLSTVDADAYSLLHGLVQYNFPQLVALWLEMGRHGGLSRREVVNLRDRWGVTGLILAAANGHEECTALLLRHGADAAAQDCEGLTAEEWARRRGHRAVLRILREKRCEGR
ncbi:hypothetical protein AB1Y20_020633 [Prymnesium parvum]|uniref:Ankyrin repeat domain-containing protein n=1 Tax=Prymnesium parvum TaxID=97485 RepID=A0AB34JY01_PRYPA